MLHAVIICKQLQPWAGCSLIICKTSSKLPALRLLEVCWTFAGSCKHPITGQIDILPSSGWHKSLVGLSGVVAGLATWGNRSIDRLNACQAIDFAITYLLTTLGDLWSRDWCKFAIGQLGYHSAIVW